MKAHRSWLVSAGFCVMGIVFMFLGWGIYHQPDMDVNNPLARIGTSFKPEKMEDIHSKGISHFSIARRASRIMRIGEQGTLAVIKKGKIGNAQTQTVEGSKGRVEYPASGAAWGEKSPCLVWQFPDMRLDRNSDFGGIELKITDRRIGEHVFHISFISRMATVPLVSGESMTYVIEPDMATGPSNTRMLDGRKSLDVVFPDIENGGEVELHSLRILGKAAGYAEAASGYGYETLDHETRPVVYQWADGLIAWNVEVPGSYPVLTFGTGLLPRSAPVTFTVSVARDNREKEIFRKTVQQGDSWGDYSVDLSAWKGDHASIRLGVSAPAPALGLWSSPRIVQSGQKGTLFCLYVVDALRADACEGFESLGAPANTTPAIRELARKGVLFTGALANAPITKYSLSSLFTGLYPSHTGIMKYQRIPDAMQTLPEVLRQEGFVTASFVLNSNAGRLRGLHQGFDYLYDVERISREGRNLQMDNGKGAHGKDQALASAGLINDFLFNFMRAHQEEDLFLYLHLMDTHAPYLPDEELMDIFYESMSRKGIDVPADRSVLLTELKYTQRPHYSPQEHLSAEALIELYRLSARTADKHLQEFMDFLQSEGRAADTTLVFTADHGEHLNEHPDILQFTHMHPMYLEVLRIPLVIYAPGLLRGGTVISKPVQLADVMPTLLDLAGIGYAASQYDGISLLALAAGEGHEFFSRRPIISQSSPHWSVLLGDIHCPDITRGCNVTVFNIDMDPGEHTPLTGSPARRGMDRLLDSLSMLPQRAVPGEDTIITNELALQQLKDLGYIQ